MPYVVRIMARAVDDIEAAAARIAQVAPQAAANWHDRLLEKVKTLKENPDGCPLAEEAHDLGIELRELLFGKRSRVWRVLFKVEVDVVKVLRVRRATQDRITEDDL